MNLTLKVWRQKNSKADGKLVTYPLEDVSEHSLGEEKDRQRKN